MKITQQDVDRAQGEYNYYRDRRGTNHPDTVAALFKYEQLQKRLEAQKKPRNQNKTPNHP